MKYFKIIYLLCLGLLVSCGDKREVSSGDEVRDSLLMVIEAKNKEIALNDYTTTQTAAVLDSISKYENLLITNQEGTPTRATALNNLKRFQEILDIYKNKMNAIQDSLSKTKNANKSLITIVEQLNSQLQAKEQLIASLRQEIQTGKREIRTLRADISSLSESNKKLEASKKLLTKVADTQDKMINRGYFIVGTKASLKQKGILKSGGLFKKSTLNTANFNVDDFISVDIRVTKDIAISGKSPKILSPMPAGSYHWEGSRLIIDNPSMFWKTTNYLVVQVN